MHFGADVAVILTRFIRNLLFHIRLITEGNKYEASSLDCPSTLHEEQEFRLDIALFQYPRVYSKLQWLVLMILESFKPAVLEQQWTK
ncbi:hypothetical protein HNY73_017405 [Argiope bruennichi]|uniref:Uncharacterized protein n=1 Tax=Argiope bruennichi TaxID=94029 RepID=A0A8T0E9T1_ARGBR|nr:hypothetical protein HNY73_017405 [Argiope bruennichi]